MNLRIPEDISLFRMNIRNDDRVSPQDTYQWTGLCGGPVNQGHLAVDLVSTLLERGELGLVGIPTCWQIDSLWAIGKTLRLSIADQITPEGFLRTVWPRTSASA